MKKIIFFASFIFPLLFLASCGNGNNPKDVAVKFFTAINERKFNDAAQYATADSKEFLQMIEKMSKEVPDTTIKAQKDHFVVDNVKITGETATADIRTKTEPKPISVSFKKENGQWKVAFDKNAVMKMAGNGTDTQQPDINQQIDDALDSAKTGGKARSLDTSILQLPQ